MARVWWMDLKDSSKFWVAALVVGIVFSTSLPALGKVDPASGLIRVICIGESYYPETRLPILLRADPKIRYQPVPANWYESTFATVGVGRNDAVRFLRQYLPRTYRQLVEKYDVLLLSDFEVDIITAEQFSWMERGVREGGMGIGKYEMNFDPGHFGTFDRFVASEVYKAFPADLRRGQEMPTPLEGIYPVPLPSTGKPHPMLNLPGIDRYKLLGSGTYGYEDPRQGATVIAAFKPTKDPAMIIWNYGKGRSLTVVPGLDKIDGAAVANWPYCVDFWINQMWYLSDVPIPKDVELVHTLREKALNYINERSLATSLIDFVEQFGASTRKLYEMLDTVDDMKRESDALYLQGRYDESLEKLDQASVGLRRVAAESVKVKQEALFWIYSIEWLSVTGTAILAGFIIWSLMVRRKLYREVSVTRAG